MKNSVFHCLLVLFLTVASSGFGQTLIGGLPRQAALDMTLRFEAPNTARITRVTAGGKAEKAGLRTDDQV
ncbi:MAG: hypothetical protein MUD08_17170, partial [Cytophagales bacterium]|nr:hypothetical protein [Cytophagales bacterium]